MLLLIPICLLSFSKSFWVYADYLLNPKQTVSTPNKHFFAVLFIKYLIFLTDKTKDDIKNDKNAFSFSVNIT